MNITLDELISAPVPDDLSGCSLAELRAIRDHHQDVENGLSYVRRIVQGRLDTITVEIARRTEGEGSSDLIDRLPDALAAHTRGPGLPRPMPDLDPPAWADELLSRLDDIMPASRLAHLAELSDDDLGALSARLSANERDISGMRHELHRSIDRVQDEIVGRYRSGASVDDLLR